MKIFDPGLAGIVRAGMLLVATGTVFSQGPVLPKWEDDASIAPLGGGLWPDDFNPDDVIHPAMISPGDDDRSGMQAEEDSWLRFLPRGLFSNRKPQEPVAPQLVNFSDEALRAAENAAGDTRVLDPQGILAEAHAGELGRLLDFHGKHAGVEARFLLLDANEQLAPDADLSRLASGEIARGSACLVVYPLGAPQRARLFLTCNVTKVVEPSYLESLAGACRREAMETPDPFEQLQRFATQLSIRLFWLERAYPAVKPEAVAPPLTLQVEEPAAPLPVQMLSEVTPIRLPQAREKSWLDAWRREWTPYAGMAFAVLLAAALLLVMLVRWQRRRLRRTVWLLPEYDHRQTMRFSGPHCGGNGVAIKYG